MKKPNLLLIQTDQHSCWSLGAYGAAMISTPNIDRIAVEGAVANNFFTNSAVCTPSRACLLSGCYPHKNGAYANNLTMKDDTATLSRILWNAGYMTGYIGKWHLDGHGIPGFVSPENGMGFADCRYMFNRGHWKSIVKNDGGWYDVSQEIGDEKTYTTDFLCDRAAEFISKPSDVPFFLMISLPDPHQPYTVREPYASMFKPEDMEIPPTFEQTDQPSWAKKEKKYTEAALRRNKAAYLGEVKCIDDNIGKLFAALEARGILDETIIVLTTDHGDYMGEHGLNEKNRMYEAVYRIPFLMRCPPIIPAGTVVEPFMSMIDVQPTLLGLMGIDPSGNEDGRDCSALFSLKGSPPGGENEVYVYHSSCSLAGIITDEYLLAFSENEEGLLIDRINDKHQSDNLYGNEKYKPYICEQREKLARHHRAAGSPAADWLEKPSSSKAGMKISV